MTPTGARAGGFTLLEVLIALAILGFGLLSLAAMQVEALSQGSKGRHSSDAASVGRSFVEQVMRLPWAELDIAQGVGTWTAPAWTGATPVVNVTVAEPGGGTAIEHSYNVLWRVSDVNADPCLRDIEIRVSWQDEGFTANRTFDLATRRFDWEDPDC